MRLAQFATLVALGLAGCSNSDFTGGDAATAKAGAPSTTKPAPADEPEPDSGSGKPTSTAPPTTAVSAEGIGTDVDEVSVRDQGRVLMIRATRGINLKTKVAGILVNPADKQILDNSDGLFVASGWKLSPTFNEVGLLVKQVRPAIAGTKITRRLSACTAGEVMVGLPDTAIDVNSGMPQAQIAGVIGPWKNNYLCAELLPAFKISDTTTVQYVHQEGNSADCSSDYLMQAYNCGVCDHNLATITCVKVGRK